MEGDKKLVGERWRRTAKVGKKNQSQQNRRIDKFVEMREREVTTRIKEKK